MKIIIISYYYPPCNSIASLRPYSWANNWSKQNHNVTVITRGWSNTDNNWNDFLSSSSSTEIKIEYEDNYKLIQLPYKRKEFSRNKYYRKATTLLNHIKGNFHIEFDINQFKNQCENEIEASKPDFIIVSAPPLNLIKLGYELCQKHGIRFVADFRDYENFSTLKINPNETTWKKLDLYLKNKYLKKWLSEASVISVASIEFAIYFKKKKIAEDAKEFTNGYELDIFNKIKTEEKNHELSISIIGSILPNQDSQCFLKGFSLFLEEYPNAKIKIDFIGGKALKEVAELWMKSIPPSILNVTSRINRDLALSIGKKADILFYPGWVGYKGMYSGKIFDYLGLKRNILIAPKDDNTIDKLIKETNSGKTLKTSYEVKEQLSLWDNEWEKKGELTYDGIESEIIKFSREKIANSLLNEIENSFEK